MAFLFGKKKGGNREGTPTGPAASVPGAPQPVTNAGASPASNISARDEPGPSSPVIQQRPQPGPFPPGGRAHQSQDSIDHGAPPSGAMQPGRPPMQAQQQSPNGPQQSPQNNDTRYPWSQRRLALSSSHPSPFPRYGHAANAVSSKDGDVYIMGGLIRSQNARGDLWMVEGGNQRLEAYPVITTSQGPGPRVGHASLLVGNAFIVFGGDTNDDRETLDETLYLLNTSTRQWSLARPQGHRPCGRYGHTLNIIGSKLYVFGGQVDSVFFNDLVSFDLNTLQHPGSKWELVSPTPESKGDVPASRTNHTIITWNEKLYLFGGTNGTQWFNDVWSFDPKENQWTQLDCIGFIPSARENHAAALVNDVMYVFGGRSSDGTDLGDLAAFRISTRRWYTFQNMGPSPSPRSGHSMTTVGSRILVLGGEPSVPTSSSELQLVYVLDTSKIKYPSDNPNQNSPTTPGGRRMTVGARNGSVDQGGGRPVQDPRMLQQQQNRGLGGPVGPGPMGPGPQGSPLMANNTSGPGPGRGPGGLAPRPGGPGGAPGAPQSGPASSPRLGGPMNNGPQPIIPRGQNPMGSGGPMGPNGGKENISPTQSRENLANGPRGPMAVVQRKESKDSGIVSVPGSRTASRQQQHQQQPSIDSNDGMDDGQQGMRQGGAQPHQMHQHQDSRAQIDVRSISDQPSIHDQSPTKPNVPRDLHEAPRSPQLAPGSQSEEFDKLKRLNDWYASELALARRAGYTPQTSNSALLNEGSQNSLPENERPFIEAMLALKGELAKVQGQVEQQASVAAQRVRDIERQRDVAIQEAVYSKAKLAALGGPSRTPTPGDKGDTSNIDEAKMTDMSRKLAASLGNQADLSAKVEVLNQEIAAERKARHLADETASAAQARISELDEYRNFAGSEIERLRAELFDAEKAFRDESQTCKEAVAEAKLLRIDQTELGTKLKDALAENANLSASLIELNRAMQVNNEKTDTMSRQLEEERLERERLERKLAQVKSEYEEKTADLDNTHQRLKDVEELCERYAEEAKAANAVLVAGLSKVGETEKESGEVLTSAAEERVRVLQEQVDSTRELLTKSKQQADETGERLAQAMQRVAGLEYQQGQSSKDSIALRRRMAEVGDEARRLKQENAELEQRLSDKQLEVDAITAKHNALKEILSERSNQSSAVDKRMSLALQSPSPVSGSATPEQTRLREVEVRLEESLRAHRETKLTADMQAQEVEKHFRDKLEQLEADYQSAVHYVKGTEKVIKRMKDELAKYKTQNKRLQLELEEASNRLSTQSRAENEADWEQERELLNKEIDDLRSKVRESATALDKQIRETKQQLDSLRDERDQLKLAHNQLQLQVLDNSQQVSELRNQVESLVNENNLLENRAQSAEQKVSMLLDQVEHSVDVYRRSTRLENMNGAEPPSARSSFYSGPDERTSMALDSLATELDALRTRWDIANDNRLSSNFEFEQKTPTSPQPEFSSSIAQWRQKLQQEEENQMRNSYDSRDELDSPTTPTMESHRNPLNGRPGPGGVNQL